MTIKAKGDADFDFPSAVITAHPDHYYEAIWFVGNGEMDWMGCIYRDEHDVWHGRYRFRYYVNNGPWGDKDQRSGAKMTGEKDKLVKAFDEIARMTRVWYGANVNDKIVVQGDAEKALRLMRRKKWCHVRVTTVEPDRPQ